MTDFKSNILSVAIGIRFRSNFTIEDKLGQIIDGILYKKNAFFNPTFFPVAHSNPGIKVLSNEVTKNSLHIESTNIFLELFFEKYDQGFLDEVHKHFEKDIIQGVLHDLDINDIFRIGYITRYKFQEEEIIKKFFNATIGETIENVQDLNIRFSKKYPLFVSLLKNQTNDYNNVIYNFFKVKDNPNLMASIDFQRLYDPVLAKSISIKFPEFTNDVNRFNSKQFKEWFEKKFGDINAVA